MTFRELPFISSRFTTRLREIGFCRLNGEAIIGTDRASIERSRYFHRDDDFRIVTFDAERFENKFSLWFYLQSGERSLPKKCRSCLLRRRRSRPFRAEFDGRNNCEQNEEYEHHKLGELKWLLGLCRSHRFQRRYFFERLHHTNEDIEIKRNQGANDVDPPPKASEALEITRVNRNRKEER